MPKIGTLRKEGNIYYYRVYIDRRQREISTGCTRRRDAVKRAEEIYRELSTPDPVTPDGFKLGALVDKYLKREARRDLSPLTLKEKTYIMNDHVIPYFGRGRDVRDLTVFDIEDYCDDKTSGDKPLSPNTVVKHYHYLNQLFKFLCKIDVLQKNIVDLADHPSRVKSTASATFSADQARLYLDLIRDDTAGGYLDPSFEIAVHLALLGGARREECAGVKLSNTRLIGGKNGSPDRFAVRINTAIIIDSGTKLIEKGTKTGEDHTIILPAESTPLIKAQIVRQKEAMLKYGPGAREVMGEYLVGDDLFQPVNPDWITRTHRRLLLKRYKDQLPYIRFHDLRHTHATLLRDAGVPLADISDKLGHSSINITDAIYIHTDDDRIALSAEAIERII